MLNNGPFSWIVISRGPNECVDEVHEAKDMHSCDEEMANGTSIEKSTATKQQEQSSPPSKSSLQDIRPN